jgi:trans-aconitate methyltransferase
MLGKVVRILVTPRKWGKIFSRSRLLLHNATRYKSFSLNPNTRSYWDKRLSGFGDYWRDENYHQVLDLFPKEDSFTLLDIGCAIGDGCELLQKAFPQAKITGSDISSAGIAKARARKSPVNYFVLDVLTDEIEGMYDYVLIVETLEHFDNPYPVIEKCLKHARRALIVSVPYNQELGNMRLEYSEHRFSFNERTFERYNCRVARVTDFLQSTQDRCIIYEFKP